MSADINAFYKLIADGYEPWEAQAIHAERIYNLMHPVYGPPAPPSPIFLSMFDDVLKNTYAPAMREHLVAHRSLMDMIRGPGHYESRRCWWKPWTWRRKPFWVSDRVNIDAHIKAHWKVAAGQEMRGHSPIQVILDETVPPGTGYFINPHHMYFEDADWDWDADLDPDDAQPHGYDPNFEEWHDMGGDA